MLRTYWLAHAIRREHGPLLSFALANALVLTAGIAHLACMLAAPGLYRRRRAPMQFCMRLLRLLVYVWHSIISGDAFVWWHARLLAPAADPARSLSVSLAGASMSYFVFASERAPPPAAAAAAAAAAADHTRSCPYELRPQRPRQTPTPTHDTPPHPTPPHRTPPHPTPMPPHPTPPSVLNPCPMALQPPLVALALLTWTHGFAGVSRQCWQHPKLQPAALAMCEWLQLVMLAVNNAGFAAFG
jgi:hypothetical protein